jgi:hypothetical protein
MSDSAEPQTLTVAFSLSPARQVIAATGAYGGPSPDGAAIITHFFVEHGTIPTALRYPVNEDGTVNAMGEERLARSEITREVLVSLVLAPEVAERVAQFLIEKAAEAKEFRSMVGAQR